MSGARGQLLVSIDMLISLKGLIVLVFHGLIWVPTPDLVDPRVDANSLGFRDGYAFGHVQSIVGRHLRASYNIWVTLRRRIYGECGYKKVKQELIPAWWMVTMEAFLPTCRLPIKGSNIKSKRHVGLAKVRSDQILLRG